MTIIHEKGHNICKLIHIVYSGGGHQSSQRLISLLLWLDTNRFDSHILQHYFIGPGAKVHRPQKRFRSLVAPSVKSVIMVIF